MENTPEILLTSLIDPSSTNYNEISKKLSHFIETLVHAAHLFKDCELNHDTLTGYGIDVDYYHNCHLAIVKNVVSSKYDFVIYTSAVLNGELANLFYPNTPYLKFRYSGKNKLWYVSIVYTSISGTNIFSRSINRRTNFVNDLIYDKASVDLSKNNFIQQLILKFGLGKKRTSKETEMTGEKMSTTAETKNVKGNLSKMFGKIGKAENGLFAMAMNGTLAVKSKKNNFISVVDGVATNLDEFVFELDGFFYYMPCLMKDVRVNDIIVHKDTVGFAIEVTPDHIQVYDINEEAVKTVSPSTHVLFKTNYVTRVCSIFDMFKNFDGTGEESSPNLFGGQFNPLMFMMFNDNNNDKTEKFDLKTLMMLSMFSGGKMQMGNMNPMMLFMLFGDGGGGDMKSLFPFMCMNQSMLKPAAASTAPVTTNS